MSQSLSVEYSLVSLLFLVYSLLSNTIILTIGTLQLFCDDDVVICCDVRWWTEKEAGLLWRKENHPRVAAADSEHAHRTLRIVDGVCQ